MALTMTRNRTQTALTKLAERVASVHGELAYVDGRLAGDLPEPLREGLARRRGELVELREALYLTLQQFDPGLDPKAIGATDEWLRPYGRGMTAKKRYEAAVLRRTAPVAASAAPWCC